MLPEGCTNVEEIPNDLLLAITHAQRIISWQENVMAEEMPERWMWHLDHEVEKWFEKVAAERSAKYGGGSDDSDSDDSMDTSIMVNEYAAKMRGN